MTGKKKSFAAWCAALAVLAAALVYFNVPGPEEAPVPPQEALDSAAPLGNQPGQRLPDFSLALMDGGEFSLNACRGKAVILNLWATWCGPCVKELPYFQRLHENYPDEAAVLAIHSELITDDVAAFLANYDYTLPFAVDEDGRAAAIVGASLLLPQTVVLDRRGEVIYNQVGSVTYEALEELVLSAMGKDTE